MSKNTAVGIILIVFLFVWSIYNTSKQQELAQAELQRKARELANLEKARQDSLNAIKGEKTNSGTLELREVPPFAVQDVAEAAKIQADSIETVRSEPKDIRIETDRFWITLSSIGAKITSIVPKTLADSLGNFPELLQNKEAGALSVSFDNADFSNVVFSVDEEPDIAVKDSAEITFEWKDENGKAVTREYKFTKDGHSVRHVTRIKGFVPRLYTLSWKGGMRETEDIPMVSSFGMSYLFSEVVLNNTYNVRRETLTKQEWFNENRGKALWFGLRRKYVAAIINFDGESEAALGAEPIKEKRNEKDPGTYALTISDNMMADSVAVNFTVLPLRWREIKEMERGYEKIIVSGWEWIGADKWFVWLCGILLQVLNAFYSIIPNYGIAIILLTILVKIITTPLALKQMRSTRSMMALKPELDAIRAKNRGDMRAQQQEIMALYAKHGISPFSGLAGCLPMLLQMPIFIGLFIVLGRAIELREAPFLGWISDLSKSDVVWRGFSIPYIMPEGIAILPFIMVLTTWIQMKQTITDPNQKMMVWMMPAMMFVFSMVMPSGLVLYWTISNLWSIAQYMVINRKPVIPVKGGNTPKAKIVEAKVVKNKRKR